MASYEQQRSIPFNDGSFSWKKTQKPRTRGGWITTPYVAAKRDFNYATLLNPIRPAGGLCSDTAQMPRLPENVLRVSLAKQPHGDDAYTSQYGRSCPTQMFTVMFISIGL